MNTTQTTHTPGPWYEMTKGDNTYQSSIAQEATGKTVAVTYTSNDADARLIAAAPELLGALQVICARFEGHYDHPGLAARGPLNISMANDMYFYAKSAISKAEGNEP